jgi:pimeloyl-ACP methyl ester carboxylesterase
MAQARVDGLTLEYEVRGEGEPVLLIHAALCTHWFAPLLGEPALGRFKLIRYDRAGYSGSGKIAGPVSIAEHARHADALLGRLGIETAHVVGHSSGGNIALQLALDAPGRVHSLALLEPAITAPASGPQVAQTVLMPALERFRAGDNAGAIEVFLSGVAGPGWRAAMERGLPGGYEKCLAGAGAFFGQEMPALRAWSFTREHAARIAQPVLAVLGERSDTARPGSREGLRVFQERHELLLTWLPQAEPFVLPMATHLLQVENPGGVAKALADFFTRHPI